MEVSMLQKVSSAILLVLFAFAVVTSGFAQDAKAKDAKKEMHQATLKSVSCDPTCGFMCRSHDEKELTAIVKTHAKKAHKMDLTDKQVKDMMKSE
jgi:predicted small metal-binding protein